MDVLRLIDRLEGLAGSATRIPMTSRIVVDEQEFLDLVDQIRVAFPEEVRNARKLSQEREKLLSQAQAEAERIVSGAHDQVASLVSTNEVVVLAQQHADEILERARREAAEIRTDANAYAVEALVRLEAEMQRFAAQIRKARAVVEQRGGGDGSWNDSSPASAMSAGNGGARSGDSPSV